MTREWFTTYCQNAAANVLDRDGKIRFDMSELKTSLNDITSDASIDETVDGAVLALHRNIVNLCNTKHGKIFIPANEEQALVLTLLNIHAAYLMISGLWKEEKPVQTGGVDEYGFEIF